MKKHPRDQLIQCQVEMDVNQVVHEIILVVDEKAAAQGIIITIVANGAGKGIATARVAVVHIGQFEKP